MSTVAAQVGGSKATLYQHFASKEALFFAVLDEAFEADLAAALVLENPDSELKTALTELGIKLLRFTLSERVLAVRRLVIAESQRFPDLGRRHARNIGAGMDAYAELFSHWMAEGRMRACDPRHAVEAFGALCQAGLYQARLLSLGVVSEDEIAANVARAVEIFLAYCAPKDTRLDGPR